MNEQPLVNVARTLVGCGRGLLAMDESTPTCNKRFAAVGIPQTEDARRAYRELLITTPRLGDCMSGAILYDETIRQHTKEGIPFAERLAAAGIVPGIKVDTGATNLAGHPGEKVTEGLDGLRDRLVPKLSQAKRRARLRIRGIQARRLRGNPRRDREVQFVAGRLARLLRQVWVHPDLRE